MGAIDLSTSDGETACEAEHASLDPSLGPPAVGEHAGDQATIDTTGALGHIITLNQGHLGPSGRLRRPGATGIDIEMQRRRQLTMEGEGH